MTVARLFLAIIEAARVAGCKRLITEGLATGSTMGGTRIENPFA